MQPLHASTHEICGRSLFAKHGRPTISKFSSSRSWTWGGLLWQVNLDHEFDQCAQRVTALLQDSGICPCEDDLLNITVVHRSLFDRTGDQCKRMADGKDIEAAVLRHRAVR